MPTSTLPLWWNEDTILELLNAARDGASYQEMEEVIRESLGGAWRGRFRTWVVQWKDKPQDRPQARLAAAIHEYSPQGSRELAAMKVLDRALATHRTLCECGQLKDSPEELTCRDCAVLEAADPPGRRRR